MASELLMEEEINTRQAVSQKSWLKKLGFILAASTVFLMVMVMSAKRMTFPEVLSFKISSSGRVEELKIPHVGHSGNNIPGSRPKEHIYYLKTHKTGSATIYSILAEYCRTHALLPLLPRKIHINTAPPLKKNQLLLDSRISKYDMVFNHHVFSPKILKYLHNDTFVFTTIREPFSQMVSSFQYFRDKGQMPYLNNIEGDDPVSEYLSHQAKYEAKGYKSYTNNRQSMDLGYDISHSFSDTEYIEKFIALTDNRFDLVLISDYFHESLVILKRTLNWSTKSILYYRKNARQNVHKYENENISMEIPKRQHANFSLADISLYNHFLKKFKNRMAREIDLDGEVKEFEDILASVHAFCDSTNTTTKRLDIPSGRWTDPFTLLRSKCKWLKLPEVEFTTYLQKRQEDLLFQT